MPRAGIEYWCTIRKGQAEGRIAKVGQVKTHRIVDVGNPDIHTVTEVTGMNRGAVSDECYSLTDNISDAEFEEALGEVGGSPRKPAQAGPVSAGGRGRKAR